MEMRETAGLIFAGIRSGHSHRVIDHVPKHRFYLRATLDEGCAAGVTAGKRARNDHVGDMNRT
jgi:hypothetical protein